MKSKITKKIFLLLLVPIVYFVFFSGFKRFTPEIKQAMSTSSININDFFIYILSAGYQDSPNSYWNIDNHIDYYDELNFNGAHFYSSNTNTLGHFTDEQLSPGQIGNMNNLIDLAEQNGMQRIFDRNRISKLCFSQRLIYEISDIGNDTATNYGFCYRNKMNNTYTTDTIYGKITDAGNFGL